MCSWDLFTTQEFLRDNIPADVLLMMKKYKKKEIEAIPAIKHGHNIGIQWDIIQTKKKDLEEKKIEEIEEVFIPDGPNLFETMLTDELTIYLFEFLDPISLGKVGLVCKPFFKITQNPLLFKKYCLRLYKSIPSLPKNSPFKKLLHAINNAGFGEYTTATIQAANQDIRSLVWSPSIQSYYTPVQYFKAFKNYRDIYINAPRLRFGGVYQMKEKYIRSGTKDLTDFYKPYHVIEFYRYLRFYTDGFVISYICSK